jgi:hypothetical protein
VTKEEICRYFATGSTRSVCVDIQNCSQYAGWVRIVTLRPPASVMVEYETWGIHEGGMRFTGHYHTLDEAIAALEQFFQRPLSRWNNYTKTGEYPEEPLPTEPHGTAQLVSDLQAEAVPLPEGAAFALAGNTYWSSLAP